MCVVDYQITPNILWLQRAWSLSKVAAFGDEFLRNNCSIIYLPDIKSTHHQKKMCNFWFSIESANARANGQQLGMKIQYIDVDMKQMQHASSCCYYSNKKMACTQSNLIFCSKFFDTKRTLGYTLFCEKFNHFSSP